MKNRNMFLACAALSFSALLTACASGTGATNANTKAYNAAANASVAPTTPVAKHQTIISTPTPTVMVTKTTPGVATIINPDADAGETTTTTTTTIHETAGPVDSTTPDLSR